MNFHFARNKYKTELLIDCFEQKGIITIQSPKKAFLVSFYEIIIVKKGKGYLLLDNETIHFKKGTVLLLPPNKWRKWKFIEQHFESTYLIFEEESLSTFFSDALYLYRLDYFFNFNNPSYVVLSDTEFKDLIETLDELQNELTQIRNDSMHLMRSILYYILIRLNRIYRTSYDIEIDIYQKNNILRFKKLLETHIATKHRVKHYAELLEISTSHLNKLVQKYFRKTASQYIRERLIIEIKRQLSFSNKSISEISYQLNFSEPSNFIRFFQKAEKQTPTQYRNQNDYS